MTLLSKDKSKLIPYLWASTGFSNLPPLPISCSFPSADVMRNDSATPPFFAPPATPAFSRIHSDKL